MIYLIIITHYFIFCTYYLIFIPDLFQFVRIIEEFGYLLDRSICYFRKMDSDNELKKIGKILNVKRENARIAQEKFDRANGLCFHCHMKGHKSR